MARTTKAKVLGFREIAEIAGYVDPYPALGVAPVADIDEDRCEVCRWTLYVAMDCGVFCANPRCERFRYDLRQDVPDGDDVETEIFCENCKAGMESSEHHEKCVS